MHIYASLKKRCGRYQGNLSLELIIYIKEKLTIPWENAKQQKVQINPQHTS